MQRKPCSLSTVASRLSLAAVAAAACTHTPVAETAHTIHISNEAEFLDYLPQSAVTGKLRCTLTSGEYAVFAPPLTLDQSQWVFVNFKEKPEACKFWQGFVRAEVIGTKVPTNETRVSGFKDYPNKETNAADKTTNARVSERLLATYGTKNGYGRIEADVLSWYGEKREGCVAFASSVLRSVGEPIPLASLKGDDAISIVTKPFVEYLTETLGYEIITNLELAQPGDIGVTVDDKRAPGYPTHVYVFAQWESKSEKIARVIDNQGFNHLRPMLASTDPRFVDKDPTAYFLRPKTNTAQ